MPVTLRVSSFQSQALGADAARVFQSGGTIGRSPDNDWVLPDPERFVSGQHAVISLENGAYVLTDHSTNGTIVNGREMPKGGRVLLGTGDLLTIGSYEIAVSVDDVAGAWPSSQAQPVVAPNAGSYPVDSDPISGGASVDPLDFFSDSPPAGPIHSPGAQPDHVPADSEFFAPPGVAPDPTPRAAHAEPPAGGAGLIPENWDATGFSAPAAAPSPSAPSPPAARPADPASDSAWAGPDATLPPAGIPPFDAAAPAEPPRPASGAFGAASRPAADVEYSSGASSGQHATGASPAPRPLPGASRLPHGAADPRTHSAQASNASGTMRGPGYAARANAAPAGGADVGALLRAAGIDPASVDEATLASLGEILRIAVDGLMDVLRARTAIKNQFRVQMTTLKPVENNPLKFSANAEDALFNLFARRGQSFKAPADAFREAFDDLRAHQIALMAGMRAAFASLLGQFDPDKLQEGFDRGLKRGALLEVMNKTKYWDLYREMYEGFGDDDATFRRLFGDEFAQAYEEQMQRLTTLKKR